MTTATYWIVLGDVDYLVVGIGTGDPRLIKLSCEDEDALSEGDDHVPQQHDGLLRCCDKNCADRISEKNR